MKKGTLASLIGIALAGSASAQQNTTSDEEAAQSPGEYQSRAQEQYQQNQEPAPANSMPTSEETSERMRQMEQAADGMDNPMNDPIIEQQNNIMTERAAGSMADGVSDAEAIAESGMKNLRGLTAMDPADLEGKPIFNINGEEVGDVDSIKVEKATKERVAIVGIQGVIGDEMKEVAIPLSQLNMKPDGAGLETSMTKNQREQRPDVDPFDSAYADVDEFEEAE